MTTSASILTITLGRGIYRVTRDDVFHCDYIMRRRAVESASDAAHALRAEGRAVQIVMAPDEA